MYKVKRADAKIAARELGVRFLVEGSVRKLGERVRISAALVDALGGLTEDETGWLTHVMQIDRNMLPAEMRSNLPNWLYTRLAERFGEDETLQMAQTLNTPAPRWSRSTPGGKGPRPRTYSHRPGCRSW